MRDSKRIPIILDELKKLWEQMPDQRLGQIIFNYATKRGRNLFNQEDEFTYQLLKAWNEEIVITEGNEKK